MKVLHRFEFTFKAGTGFGCSLFDLELIGEKSCDEPWLRFMASFLVSIGDERTSASAFLKLLGIDFRSLKSGVHHMKARCTVVQREDHTVSMKFDNISTL